MNTFWEVFMIGLAASVAIMIGCTAMLFMFLVGKVIGIIP